MREWEASKHFKNWFFQFVVWDVEHWVFQYVRSVAVIGTHTYSRVTQKAVPHFQSIHRFNILQLLGKYFLLRKKIAWSKLMSWSLMHWKNHSCIAWKSMEWEYWFRSHRGIALRDYEEDNSCSSFQNNSLQVLECPPMKISYIFEKFGINQLWMRERESKT